MNTLMESKTAEREPPALEEILDEGSQCAKLRKAERRRLRDEEKRQEKRREAAKWKDLLDELKASPANVSFDKVVPEGEADMFCSEKGRKRLRRMNLRIDSAYRETERRRIWHITEEESESDDSDDNSSSDSDSD